MKKKYFIIIVVFIVIVLGVYSIHKRNNKILDIDNKNINLMFNLNNNKNQQGLTYSNGYFYVGFDRGNQTGEIIKFDNSGKMIDSTGKINIGHAAGLAFREKMVIYM